MGNRRSRRPRARGECFRIGSATKAFTATVVLQLVAERHLDLDDTVAHRLPDVPVHNCATITIRQLLNHTNGLFDYTQDPQTTSRTGWLPDELVAVAMAQPPLFEPGQRWSYCNTGYIICGMIIERITGADLAQEMQRRIAVPLALKGTYLAGAEEELRAKHARHYSKIMDPSPDASIYDVTEIDHTWAWATGALVSTTHDLTTFLSALLGGRLLPDDLLGEMLTTVSTEGADWIPDTSYGLGVFSQTLPCGAVVWGAAGFTIGSWSYVMATRTGDHVLASNANGDWPDMLTLFRDLLSAEFCER